MKICTKCNKLKSLESFSKRKSKKDGLKSQCKHCDTIDRREYYSSNKEKELFCVKKWYLKNKTKAGITARTWEKNNMDRVKLYRHNYNLINKEKRGLYALEWSRKNKARRNANQMRRYAAKISRTPNWLTDNHKKEIIQFYEEASRLTQITGIRYEVDHIVPLQGVSVSGLHVPWNLQVITKHENCVKKNSYGI